MANRYDINNPSGNGSDVLPISDAVKSAAVSALGGGADATAKANAAQAAAIQRANHTGTQPISSISDLQDELDGKEPAGAVVALLTTDNSWSGLQTFGGGFTVNSNALFGPLASFAYIGNAANTHRAALDVAGLTPKLYEDFSVYPDNTTLALNAPPKIGNGWRWSTTSTNAPLITGGYLRGTNNELFYFGNDVGEKIRTIAFELEFVSDGAGGGNIGTTYAFHSVPVLTTTGSGIPGLNTPNMLHFEINENGLSKMGFNEGTGANFENMQPMGRLQTGDGSVPYSSNVAGGSMFGRGRHMITFTFVGDTCLVTVLGTTWVFRHPPARQLLNFSTVPADNDTFTTGGITYRWKNTLAAANDVKIGASILISATNAAAALNASPGAGTLYGTGTVQNPLVRGADATTTYVTFEARLAGPRGNLITCSESSTATTLGGSTLVGGQRTPIAAAGVIRHWWYETVHNLTSNRGHARLYSVSANAPESYDLERQESIISRLTTNGQITLDQSFTFSGSNTHSGNLNVTGILTSVPFAGNGLNKPIYNINNFAGELSSSASASNQTLYVIPDRQLPAVGGWIETVVEGVFAANANNKRILIDNAAVTIFDTGTVTHSGKQFKLTCNKQRNSTNASRYTTTLEIQGEATVYGRATWGFESQLNGAFKVSGVAAGDITIISSKTSVGLA